MEGKTAAAAVAAPIAPPAAPIAPPAAAKTVAALLVALPQLESTRGAHHVGPKARKLLPTCCRHSIFL